MVLWEHLGPRTIACGRVRAMRRTFLVCVAVVSVVFSTVALAEDGPGAELDRLDAGERFERLLELMSERAQEIKTLQARFRQTTTGAVLLKPVVSRGVLSYRAPDAGRWEYLEPERMVVLFRDGVLTTYLPDDQTAERVTVSDRYERVMQVISGGLPLEKLRDRFRLTFSDRGSPHPYRLTLDPRSRRIERRVEKIEIKIERERLLPTVVEYIEPEGDTVRYELDDVRVDVPLSDDLFTLDLGPDVEVRTLDGLPRER